MNLTLTICGEVMDRVGVTGYNAVQVSRQRLATGGPIQVPTSTFRVHNISGEDL